MAPERNRPVAMAGVAAVLALMVYTLIERDCQANPEMAAAGLRTPRFWAVVKSRTLTRM